MYEIPNFSSYFLNEKDEVVRKSDGKIMPVYLRDGKETQKFFKLKKDTGVFVQIATNSIFALTKQIKQPEGFISVPKYPKLFISKQGEVWSSPSTKFPLGKLLVVGIPKGKYPRIRCAEYGTLAVHQLLAIAFLDSEYIEKGLCVMHLDDNKNNYSLSNLKVSSYSDNNKAAYDTGVNPSKKQ